MLNLEARTLGLLVCSVVILYTYKFDGSSVVVIAADGLYKRDVFSKQKCSSVVETWLTSNLSGFPDPFAVATIGGEQTRTTSVIKKTLNPYWNESFDM